MKLTVKETKVICSNPTNPWHNYFAWPSVARLHDGRLAMVASGFRMKHVCPFGKVILCYSDDEGNSWTRPMVVIDTPLDDRDAGILPFGENSVMITSFNNTKEAQKNWNRLPDGKKIGNRTYKNAYINGYLTVLDEKMAEERYLGSTFVISGDDTKTFSDVMRIPVTAPHGPTVMPDGSILYIGRTFSENDKMKETDCVEAYKVYPNGTYEKLGEIENISSELLSCEPHAIVLENGKIIVHIRVQNQGFFTIYQAESYDGAKTFTKPHQILEDKGGAPAHLLRLRDGTLISVYGYREKPYGIKMMFSLDEGETWSTGHDLYINGVSPDLGYPASVELTNGDILTVFYAKETEESSAVIMQTIWHLEIDPLDRMKDLNPIYRRVYEYLRTIPKGKVVTYGQIAEALGNKNLSLTVGNALHANPDGDRYPCYKVVNKDGKLAKKYAFGGEEAQTARLEAEGISVENGKVDLTKYQH